MYGYDPGDDYKCCNALLYKFAFWSITGIYVIIGLLLLSVCCCGVCFSIMSAPHLPRHTALQSRLRRGAPGDAIPLISHADRVADGDDDALILDPEVYVSRDAA